MPAKRFDFRNDDGDRLAALLDLPDGRPTAAVALFAHCFTCGKDNKTAHRIAQGLKFYGIAVLRFDFTGLGASEGTCQHHILIEYRRSSFRRRSSEADACRTLDPNRSQPRRCGGARCGPSYCRSTCRGIN